MASPSNIITELRVGKSCHRWSRPRSKPLVAEQVCPQISNTTMSYPTYTSPVISPCTPSKAMPTEFAASPSIPQANMWPAQATMAHGVFGMLQLGRIRIRMWRIASCYSRRATRRRFMLCNFRMMVRWLPLGEFRRSKVEIKVLTVTVIGV